jgi:hypothetical protein
MKNIIRNILIYLNNKKRLWSENNKLGSRKNITLNTLYL